MTVNATQHSRSRTILFAHCCARRCDHPARDHVFRLATAAQQPVSTYAFKTKMCRVQRVQECGADHHIRSDSIDANTTENLDTEFLEECTVRKDLDDRPRHRVEVLLNRANIASEGFRIDRSSRRMLPCRGSENAKRFLYALRMVAHKWDVRKRATRAEIR